MRYVLAYESGGIWKEGKYFGSRALGHIIQVVAPVPTGTDQGMTR